MTTQEHLGKIVAKCRWYLDRNYASATGASGFDACAEAGWRATIAAINLIKATECHGLSQAFNMTLLIQEIIAAWPEELLK